MHTALSRLFREDDGQDLVEYALLTATIGIAGAVAFTVLRDTMADVYANWLDPNVPGSVQFNWEVPPPIE